MSCDFKPKLTNLIELHGDPSAQNFDYLIRGEIKKFGCPAPPRPITHIHVVTPEKAKSRYNIDVKEGFNSVLLVARGWAYTFKGRGRPVRWWKSHRPFWLSAQNVFSELYEYRKEYPKELVGRIIKGIPVSDLPPGPPSDEFLFNQR